MVNITPNTQSLGWVIDLQRRHRSELAKLTVIQCLATAAKLWPYLPF